MVVLVNFNLFYNLVKVQSSNNSLISLNFAQLAHLAFSLSINICATSIIAIKAWCVQAEDGFQDEFVDFALIGHMTRAYIQEIPQVADEKRDWYPNPDAGNQDIGPPDRVGCNLYSDWRKLSLGIRVLSRSSLSLQFASLVTIAICAQFGFTVIGDVYTPVGIQLVVRNSFQGITLMVLIS